MHIYIIFSARSDAKWRTWFAEKSAVEVRNRWKVHRWKVQSPHLPSSVCNWMLEFGLGILWWLRFASNRSWREQESRPRGWVWGGVDGGQKNTGRLKTCTDLLGLLQQQDSLLSSWNHCFVSSSSGSVLLRRWQCFYLPTHPHPLSPEDQQPGAQALPWICADWIEKTLIQAKNTIIW